jgi:hypothetical protein
MLNYLGRNVEAAFTELVAAGAGVAVAIMHNQFALGNLSMAARIDRILIAALREQLSTRGRC